MGDDAMIIDAHVHLWDLELRPQPWTNELPLLKRSFRPAELAQVLGGQGVDAAVVVQASDSFDESVELLALAAVGPVIAGVVGWVDLSGSGVPAQLTALQAVAGGRALVGVRHQLQVEPDPVWLRRPSVRLGLAAVAEAGLTYDVVVSPEQLPLVIETVRAVPQLRFVLDHAGKPDIASGNLGRWAADVAELAAEPNVAVKLSGLVTEANWTSWTQQDLDPVVDHVLDSFGPARIMAGSDWPVCLLAADYPTVQGTLTAALAGLSAPEQADVLGATATRWYGLEATS